MILPHLAAGLNTVLAATAGFHLIRRIARRTV
jgi:hypothetical protein